MAKAELAPVKVDGVAKRAGTEARSLGTLPLACAVVTAINGLYIVLVAFGNITDFGTNLEFVRHVLAMDTTNFGADPGTNLDPDVMWRAITSDAVQTAAYIAIGGEWFQMWRSTAWNGLVAAFRNSVLALLGLILIHLPSLRWAETDTPESRATVAR